MGRFGSCDTRAGTQDSVGDLLHSLVLTDDPLMQHVRAGAAASRARLRSSFDTGMPVQRATMRAISSSVTRSRSRLDSFLVLGNFFFLFQLLFAGQAACRIAARRPWS